MEKVSPQTERRYKCFICSKVKDCCKIIKNQDSNDAVCKEDFIRLCTEDNSNHIQIYTPKEAEDLWKNLRRDGTLPDNNNP